MGEWSPGGWVGDFGGVLGVGVARCSCGMLVCLVVEFMYMAVIYRERTSEYTHFKDNFDGNARISEFN